MELMVPIVIIIIIVHLLVFTYLMSIRLWISAKMAGVQISLIQLIAMRSGKVPPDIIINALIQANKAGLDLSRNELEAHYLTGGNVPNVVNALITADKANIDLDFKLASAIDLAGVDVFWALQTSIKPKVVDTAFISGVTKDGIELTVKARVTLRANIQQMVGGAYEETVIARVEETMLSFIAAASDHKKILQNPSNIAKMTLAKGVDAGTAFRILSIDMVKISVGEKRV